MLDEDLYIRPIRGSDIGLPIHLNKQIYTQGRIDPVTLGCTAVKSEAKFRDNGTLERLSMCYWYRLPDNYAVEVSLFDIQTGPTGLANEINVSGRPINLSNKSAIEAALQAIRHVHEDLSESRYPNIAGAFADNDLGRYLGKNIKIVGQKTNGDFDFQFMPLFNFHSADHTSEPMALPGNDDLVKAIVGLGQNPLRPDRDVFQDKLRVVPAYDTTTQTTYENHLQANETSREGIKLHMVTHARGADMAELNPVYQDVFRLRSHAGAKHKLKKLIMMGQDVTHQGHALQARVLGAASGIMQAFARHAAPVPLSHMVKYDLRNLISDPQLVSQLHGEKNPFLRISLAGNRYTTIYGPYGSDLGNTTLLMHGGVTILNDFGFKPAPDGEKSSGAIPNIQDWLPQIDLICLTHRHLDHIGAMPYEDMRGKTVLCTPQVRDAVIDAFRTVHGSKTKERLPHFEVMTACGHKTISHDGGKSGITVIYAPNAVSHSTYCTPFYFAAFETTPEGKKIIKGVYANLGDVRDEEKDPTIDAWNNRDKEDWWWFKYGWQQSLQEAHPDLDIADLPMQPTYAEWDSTSVRQIGETPNKAEILKNLKEVVGWCDGYTVLNAHLASSDNQFDVMIQSAAYHRRDYVTAGKNMETTQRSQNIYGYEELNAPWAQGHQNQTRMDQVHAEEIQNKLEDLSFNAPTETDIEDFNAHMDSLFAQGYKMRGEKRTEFKEELEHSSGNELLDQFEHYCQWKNAEKRAEKQKDEGVRDAKIADTLKQADIHRIHLFKTWARDNRYSDLEEYLHMDMMRALHARLARYTNNYWRYKQRLNWTRKHGIDDPYDLGGIVVTRNTLTSALMMRDNPERTYWAITGTQNNEVEAEAQLVKYLEGRSLLSLDPRYRHTARTVEPHKAILIITQPPIPGNDKSRSQMVQKAARDLGMIVINAANDSFDIYNAHKLPPETLKKIQDHMMSNGVLFKGPDDTVDHKLKVMSPMAIGYRGHGRQKDTKNWMERVHALINGPQHIKDPEAAVVMANIAKAQHLGSIDMVPDFAVAKIDRWGSTPEEKVKILGYIPASITVLHADHAYQKPYGPIIRRQRVTVIDPEAGPSVMQPLMAGMRSGEEIIRDFGPLAQADARQIQSEGRPGSKPSPVDIKNFFGEGWGTRPAVAPIPVPRSARPKPQSIALV